MTIGDKLRFFMFTKHMSVKELSQKSGVSVDTIYSILSRDKKRISAKTDKKLSDVLETYPFMEMSEDIIMYQVDHEHGWGSLYYWNKPIKYYPRSDDFFVNYKVTSGSTGEQRIMSAYDFGFCYEEYSKSGVGNFFDVVDNLVMPIIQGDSLIDAFLFSVKFLCDLDEDDSKWELKKIILEDAKLNSPELFEKLENMKKSIQNSKYFNVGVGLEEIHKNCKFVDVGIHNILVRVLKNNATIRKSVLQFLPNNVGYYEEVMLNSKNIPKDDYLFQLFDEEYSSRRNARLEITNFKDSEKFFSLLSRLNEKGKEKTIEQMSMLVKIPEYQVDNTSDIDKTDVSGDTDDNNK
jgi:transcriptional regulator with XRE-family HTH domain